MWTLGLHIGLLHRDTDVAHRVHSNFDSAAALLHEGQVVAACRESALTGIARDKRFPARAIRACLDIAGRSFRDIDAIALDQDEMVLDAVLLQRALDDAREQVRDARTCVSAMFASAFDEDVTSRLRFVDPTTARMRAAFVGSGLERATSLCFEGVGAEALAVVAEQDASGVRVLKRIGPGQSLADLIDTMGDACGLGGSRVADLGAAASGGDPARYGGLMRRMHVVAVGGELYLRERAERLHMLRDAGVLEALAQADAPKRAAIQRDLVAALQATIGDLIQHVVGEARRLSAYRDVCVGGELAHDPYCVGRILRAAAFDRVRVAPVADDAGNAIGAAAHVAGPAVRTYAAPHVRWGRELDQRDLDQRLDSWGAFVVVERPKDPAVVLARTLAEGKTVALLRGRSEWSVRGLSSGVLLRDPRLPCSGQGHSLACVPRASISTHFECVDAEMLPPHADYSLTLRADAPAVPPTLRGIDGSVALHPVDASDTHLHDAIREFDHLTGVPYVLGRPFFALGGAPADGLDDAIACVLARPIDVLFYGDCMVMPRAQADAGADGFSELAAAVARGRELSCAVPAGDRIEYAILRHHETEHGPQDLPMSLPISRDAFNLMRSGDVRIRLRDAVDRVANEAVSRQALCEEVVSAWRAGFVELRPAGAR